MDGLFYLSLELKCSADRSVQPGLEIIKLENNLKLKIKRNDWLLADTCPQAANRYALF